MVLCTHSLWIAKLQNQVPSRILSSLCSKWHSLSHQILVLHSKQKLHAYACVFSRIFLLVAKLVWKSCFNTNCWNTHWYWEGGGEVGWISIIQVSHFLLQQLYNIIKTHQSSIDIINSTQVICLKTHIDKTTRLQYLDDTPISSLQELTWRRHQPLDLLVPTRREHQILGYTTPLEELCFKYATQPIQIYPRITFESFSQKYVQTTFFKQYSKFP